MKVKNKSSMLLFGFVVAPISIFMLCCTLDKNYFWQVPVFFLFEWSSLCLITKRGLEIIAKGHFRKS